jgi:hypothetical protein
MAIRSRSGDSDSYHRTSRYIRRQNRKNSDAITLPSILGPVTSVAVALGSGPLRRANLQTRFQERVLQSVRKLDAAGLIVEWQLPNIKPGPAVKIGKGRARRGIALALNSAFPLAKEVRKLAKAVANEFELSIQCDMSPAERALAPAVATFDMDRLCGSPVSTRTLMTLACFRGAVPTSIVYRCVPGHSAGAAKSVAERLERLGILAVSDGKLSFADAPWMPAFRALLRAAVNSKPGFSAEVKQLSQQKAERAKTQARFHLFGKSATERALCALARCGIMTRTELNAQAHLFADHSIFIRLRRMGLIVHLTLNHRTQISLNAAHPAFEALRNFLLRIQGVDSRNPDRRYLERHSNFSAEQLFGTKLRLSVLIMLHLSGDDGIDGSDLKRLLPQHTVRNLVDNAWSFCALDIAIEKPMDFGMIRYRLNPEYPHYESLEALLSALVIMYPQYERIFALRSRLWPPRRATREKNRTKVRLREGGVSLDG